MYKRQLHAAPSVNYASFIFLRCLLGFLESAITPAFTIITSQYWKKEEQFSRINFWFGFNGLGSIWGGAIAYGLYLHQDSYPLAAWKLVFIITGLITIFSGRGEKDAKLRFAFKIYDIDKDGFISNGELFIVLKIMVGNNLEDEQLQQIVDRTIMENDADGDGKLSFEEFKNAAEITEVVKSLTLQHNI